ncbi:hypothetical protein ACFWYW_23960 [Nonomuraea sp. NPDC059023]|uniref:hypothetical protein n=1 Tax=unclassified Nonomuraea TaxID=2593643 RepID=UPI0036862373
MPGPLLAAIPAVLGTVARVAGPQLLRAAAGAAARGAVSKSAQFAESAMNHSAAAQHTQPNVPDVQGP